MPAPRVLLVPALLACGSIAVGCSPGEPATAASREPDPAPAKPAPTTETAPEPEPNPNPEARLRAEDLVRVELGLVDAPAREALAARLGPDSALAGSEALLSIRYTIEPDWHIYWTNPGESGLRTRVAVEAEGARAGEVLYPAPERIVAEGGQVSYGWGEAAALFVPLHELGDAPAPTLRLTTRYLVCRESCIPGKVELSMELAKLEPGADATVAAMLARVPEPAGERLTTRWAGEQLEVEARGGALVELFPYASDAAVLAEQRREADALVLDYRLSASPPADLAQGVLAAEFDGAPVWLELAAPWPAS